MGKVGISLQVGSDYRMKLRFANGSEAVIDMKKRVQSMRFARIRSPEIFRTARIEENEVIWDDGIEFVRISVNELLDSMQMD